MGRGDGGPDHGRVIGVQGFVQNRRHLLAGRNRDLGSRVRGGFPFLFFCFPLGRFFREYELLGGVIGKRFLILVGHAGEKLAAGLVLGSTGEKGGKVIVLASWTLGGI